MKIEDLLSDERGQHNVAESDINPLGEAGALQEAQLLDVRMSALSSTIGVLFDLRMALQLRTGNTGLLVARQVQHFTWSAEARATRRTAWNVVGSEPGSTGQSFSLKLAFVPAARFELLARKAEFYVGDVIGISDVPPDYGSAAEALVAAGLANWQSEFNLNQAAFAGPAG